MPTAPPAANATQPGRRLAPALTAISAPTVPRAVMRPLPSPVVSQLKAREAIAPPAAAKAREIPVSVQAEGASPTTWAGVLINQPMLPIRTIQAPSVANSGRCSGGMGT